MTLAKVLLNVRVLRTFDETGITCATASDMTHIRHQASEFLAAQNWLNRISDA